MRLYISGLRTPLRRIVSARDRSFLASSVLGGIPRRYYASSAKIQFSAPAPPATSRPADQNEEELEREWNSFTLRNKVEHMLKMKDPEAATRLLQRVRVPQSVYSWNLVIKHYAHMGSYTDAYKVYQQMKKCGARPIDDTYIQLAHALNSSHSRSQHSAKPRVAPSPTSVLQLIEKLPSIQDWTAHKGTAIFLTLIAKELVAQQRNGPSSSPSHDAEVTEKLVQAGESVWTLIDPFSKQTRLNEENKEFALTHYLFILNFSRNQGQFKRKVFPLLPLLEQFPTPESRYAALRIANKLGDLQLAIKYWETFADVPPDSKSAALFLRITSAKKKPKETLHALTKIIELNPSQPPDLKYVILALSSCFTFPPDVDSIRKVFKVVSRYPSLKASIDLYQMVFDFFLRATVEKDFVRRRAPGLVYGMIRKLEIASLLGKRQGPLEKRLELIETVLKVVDWRLQVCKDAMAVPGKDTSREALRKAQILEDKKFFRRWIEIMEKEQNGLFVDEEIHRLYQAEERRTHSLVKQEVDFSEVDLRARGERDEGNWD